MKIGKDFDIGMRHPLMDLLIDAQGWKTRGGKEGSCIVCFLQTSESRDSNQMVREEECILEHREDSENHAVDGQRLVHLEKRIKSQFGDP